MDELKQRWEDERVERIWQRHKHHSEAVEKNIEQLARERNIRAARRDAAWRRCLDAAAAKKQTSRNMSEA